MKVLIVSDNHGEQGICYEAYSKNGGEINIHLGDSEFNYDDSEMGHFYRVKGNVDTDNRYPAEEFDRNTGIFFTHGHLYNIKGDREELAKRASEYDAKYALYGHSHIAMAEEAGGVYCINPGSISLPKGEWQASYAVLDTEDDVVTFFDRAHDVIYKQDL